MRSCQVCGSTLADDAPSGHCPKCLLNLGFAAAFAEQDSSANPAPTGEATIANEGSRRRRLGDYELIEQIGRGGMGVVFKARQISLRRLVAIKMIGDGHLASPAAVRRFHTEAEAAARLDHPNIVPIHEVGEQDGHHYFSMRLVEGGSLAQRLAEEKRGRAKVAAPRAGGRRRRSRARELSETVGLLATIARAVHYAHQRGILHRDLKPGNILLDPAGEPLITDFGLAKLLEQDSGATRSGDVAGTPGYMAPEQASGQIQQISTATDTYSLGAILYEILTGEQPFAARSAMESLRRMFEDELPRPQRLNPAVDPDLETICLKCLEREPGARYASAEALADDLTRWVRGEPVQARPIPLWERTRKWIRRHPAIASLIAAVAFAVALGLSATTWQWRRAEAQGRVAAATSARLRLQQAEDFLGSGRAELALATLARALRDNPADRAARERLVNALKSRSFLVPTPDRPSPMEAEAFSFAVNSQAALCLIRQGDLVANATEGSAITLQSTSTNGAPTIIRLPKPGVIRSIAVSPDQEWLAAAVAEGTTGTACFWNLRAGEWVASVPHPAEVNAVDFSPLRPVLATASADGIVRLWHVGTFTNVGQVAAHALAANIVRFHPSQPILATGGDDGMIRTWDADRLWQVADPCVLGSPVEDLRLSRAGSRMFVRLGSAEVVSLRWSTPSPSIRLPAPAVPNPTLDPIAVVLGVGAATFHVNPITCTNFSPTGDRLATASTDGTARLWDTRSRRPLTEPLLHGAAVNDVRFSPDGVRVATSTADRRARVWDADTGAPLTDPLETDAPVVGVSFSPDGAHLIASTGQAWELECAGGNAPAWLPALAEAVAMIRINEHGLREPLSPTGAAEILRQIRVGHKASPATAWLRTFIGPP